MVIALEGMTVDATVVVAVVDEHLRQVDGGVGQVLDVESHVLDNHRRAQRTRAAHTGENARSYGPILAILGGIAGEARRHVERVALEHALDGGDVVVEFTLTVGKGLHEHRGKVGAGGVVDAGQRLAVEDLGAVHRRTLHVDDGLASLAHLLEVEHGAGPEGIQVPGLHRKLARKGQCTLAAHHQVGDDVEGVGEVDKRRDIQSGDILDAVFASDALGQFVVGHDAVAQGLDVAHKLRMALAEGLSAVGVASVEDGAVGQHDAHREHLAVAIGVRAATHARGIVDDDAAHHGRVFRGRVGGERAAQWSQDLVDLRAHDARLQRD